MATSNRLWYFEDNIITLNRITCFFTTQIHTISNKSRMCVDCDYVNSLIYQDNVTGLVVANVYRPIRKQEPELFNKVVVWRKIAN